MSTSAEEWLKNFKTSEKELSKLLSQKDPTFAEIDNLLSIVRTAFENLTFSNIELATSHNAEARLWEYHSKINSRYRRQLAKFHNEEGKKKPVERRKLEGHYVKFIKSSIRFYRGYIQRLASHYGDIPELSQIASRFKMDTTTLDHPVKASSEIKTILLRSCHATLVRLGDLSRYRETETQGAERNWGPARGYYDLAVSLIPSSGLPHNQLAVIALADGHHLRALYQLYRALAVQHPHPSAKGNLDIEFKKIIQLKAKNELFPRSGPTFAERTVEAWFSYLHAMCERGEEWPEHEDIENELLSQMSVLLKGKSLENQLQRFVLINMAAEFMASQRARDDNASQSSIFRFQSFQRLNIKTFFMLLQILLPELASEDEVAGNVTSGVTDRLSPITRRILPSLRQYSSWLLSNASFLVAQTNDPFLGIHIREFWKIYANALTLLAGTFPVSDLPVIDYLLEEDEDTIGFLPVFNENTTWRYHDQSECLRPRVGEKDTSKELPHIEMLFRVREFLANGMELTTRASESGMKSIPIELVQGARFVYQEEGLPRELNSGSPNQPQPRAFNREDIERDRIARGAPPLSYSRVDDERSTAPSTSNITMANMVNRLVESDAAMEQTRGPPLHQLPLSSFQDSSAPTNPHHSPTTANNRTITARDLVKNMQQPRTGEGDSIRPLSSLSTSIWTPRPGETSGSPQVRPGTGQRPTNDSPNSTPLPLPPHPQLMSSGFFNDQLARQHQAINDRSTPINPIGTPSSWYAPSPSHDPNAHSSKYPGHNLPHHHHHPHHHSPLPPLSSPWSPFNANPSFHPQHQYHQTQSSGTLIPSPSFAADLDSESDIISARAPPGGNFGPISPTAKIRSKTGADATPPSGQAQGR